MSGFERAKRRGDAERNIGAILDAAITVLGRKPESGMDEIAAAAGVARQTVYAHFHSRRALLDAVIDRMTAQVVAELDSLETDEGPAETALRRWLDTAWGLLERYPILLHLPVGDTSPSVETERHEPITRGLSRLIRRGQRSGEFDRRFSASWLATATVALAHAAAQEVAAGRMSSRKAGSAFTESVLRLHGSG